MSNQKQHLKLLESETSFRTMCLPSVTSVTFYQGEPPIKLLRHRVAQIIALNPWLAGRLVSHKGEKVIEYDPNPPAHVSKCHFRVIKHATLCYSDSYGKIVNEIGKAKDVVVKRSFQCLNRNESLYNVTLIMHPKTNDFALVVSASHIMGGSHTFYSLYAMLDTPAVPVKLLSERQFEYEAQRDHVMGAPATFFTTFWFFVGFAFLCIRGTFIWLLNHMIMGKETWNLYTINEDWVKEQKKTYNTEQSWISANDALAAWFFKSCKCAVGCMAINFRDRLMNIGQKHAGNYEDGILYLPEDFENPRLIRESISGKIYRRVVTGLVEISIAKIIRCNIGLITNWSNFYTELTFENCKSLFHLPVLEETPTFISNAVIFCQKKNRLGILINLPNMHLEENGPLVPFDNTQYSAQIV
ncbi:hypothetical protein BC833DRAFT_582068 [Globomyces pollinis-pini]|nr:hypothetical protein BC833DRAFT_582068 [Globomyces pollinis-pini]